MKLGKWLLNILISIDQFGNACTGGDPDETISSRIGKAKLKFNGKIPWSRPLMKLIDWGLEKLDKNHSIEAIEKDEGKDAIVAKVGGRDNETIV